MFPLNSARSIGAKETEKEATKGRGGPEENINSSRTAGSSSSEGICVFPLF